MSAAIITGRRGAATLYACVDPSVRFTTGEVRSSKLGALLAPYRGEASARAALEAAGASIDPPQPLEAPGRSA